MANVKIKKFPASCKSSYIYKGFSGIIESNIEINEEDLWRIQYSQRIDNKVNFCDLIDSVSD